MKALRMRETGNKIIKTIVSLILVFISALFPMLIQGELVLANDNSPTAVIMAENKSVDPQGQITIGVYANNVTRLVGYNINITYDQAVINVISTSPKESTNYSIPGQVHATGYQDIQEGVTGNIKLFDLTIEAKGSSGTSSPLTIDVIELDGLLNYPNIDPQDIPCTIQNGSVTINSTAASIATSISAISAPSKDATQLTLPTVPEGYTIGIKSTDNSSVITSGGSIIPPSIDTTVALVLTVVRTADGTSSDTSAISVVVPAKTQTTYGALIQLSVGKGLARPDKISTAKNVRIPINVDSATFTAGFNSYSFDITYDPSKISPTGLVAYTSDNKNGIAVPTSLGQITLTDSTHASVHVQWSGTTPVGATYASSKGALFKAIFTAQTGFVSTDTQTGVGITTANFALNSNPSNNVTTTLGIVYFGMYGDVNGDGQINGTDSAQIVRYALHKTPNSIDVTDPIQKNVRLLAADVNNDGQYNGTDSAQIVRYALHKTPNSLNSGFGY